MKFFAFGHLPSGGYSVFNIYKVFAINYLLLPTNALCTAAGSDCFASFQPLIWHMGTTKTLSYVNNQQSQDERNEDEPFCKMHLLYSIV